MSAVLQAEFSLSVAGVCMSTHTHALLRLFGLGVGAQ